MALYFDKHSKEREINVSIKDHFQTVFVGEKEQALNFLLSTSNTAQLTSKQNQMLEYHKLFDISTTPCHFFN